MRIRRIFIALFGIVALAPLCWLSFQSLEPIWQAPGSQIYPATSGGPTAIDYVFVALQIVLVVICIRLVFRLPTVSPDKRTPWVVFLLFFSVFAVPLLWYSHLFREPLDHVPSNDL